MRRLLDILGRVDRSVFIVMYLTSIIVFAMIYSFIPKHFVMTTVQHEGTSFYYQKRAISNKIQNIFVSQFRNYSVKDSLLAIHNIKFDSIEFEVDIITSTELKGQVLLGYSNGITGYGEALDFAWHYEGNREIEDSRWVNSLELSVEQLKKGMGKETVFYEQIEIRPDSIVGLGRDRDFQDIISIMFSNNSGPQQSRYYLPVNADVLGDISDYVIAKTGIGSGLHGNILRMVYLSVVTITTLGYGDIVPVSNTARLLIAAEAILGTVIMGLFVNSVGGRWQKRD